MDRPFNHDYQIDGYLTPQQEATILNAREGQVIEIPQAYIDDRRQEFNKKASESLRRKIFSSAFNLGFLSLPVLAIGYSVSVPLTLLFAYAAATFPPDQALGNEAIKKRAYKEAKEKIDAFVSRIKYHAEEASKENFVKEIDARVRDGGAVNLAELAKLVNVHDVYFEEVCDKLAITVLQAKAMIAILNGDIDQYKVATYQNMGIFRNYGHREYLLRLALEDQQNHQVIIGRTDNVESDSADDTPSSGTAKIDYKKAFCVVAKAIKEGVRETYVDGWKAVIQSYRKPTSLQVIEAPKTYTVPAIPSVEDLGDRIDLIHRKMWDESKDMLGSDLLNLPALARG
jgi:hypothetical protein